MLMFLLYMQTRARTNNMTAHFGIVGGKKHEESDNFGLRERNVTGNEWMVKTLPFMKQINKYTILKAHL